MTGEAGGPIRLMLRFGAASLLAVGTGAVICALNGVPAALWIRNLAAWLVGAVAAVGVARAGPRLGPLALGAAPLLLAATFLSAGQEGVHRWVQVGPLSMNVAMLVTPAAMAALATHAQSLWSWAAALACLGLVVLQPDASQASALGATMTLIAASRIGPGAAKAAVMAASGGLALLAWLRPDPLKPVPEVEEALTLAWGISPALAAWALAVLVTAALVPAFATRAGTPAIRGAGLALSLCLALWVAAPFAGAFPVPLVGIGLTPILGSWLAVGLLAASTRGGAPRV